VSAVFASLTALPRWSALVSFASVAAVIIAVPGPSVLFVIGRAVSVGRRAAVVTVWGNAVGVYLQVLAVAAGIGAIVERSATVFTLVKTVGALYLMWLGVSAIRHRRGAEPQNEPVDDAACSDSAQADAGLADAGMAGAGVRAATPRRWFRDGVVVGAANPKSIVFFTAILPQFVDRHGPVPVQMAVLGGVFVAIALVLDTLWALAAGSARHWFASEPRRLERLTATGGVVMIGLGARLALSGRN
jgi:threonine/homoserine/homoserine lactone efflux protein